MELSRAGMPFTRVPLFTVNPYDEFFYWSNLFGQHGEILVSLSLHVYGLRLLLPRTTKTKTETTTILTTTTTTTATTTTTTKNKQTKKKKKNSRSMSHHLDRTSLPNKPLNFHSPLLVTNGRVAQSYQWIFAPLVPCDIGCILLDYSGYSYSGITEYTEFQFPKERSSILAEVT